MIKTKGYSLWLMPEGDEYKRLAGIISDLSKRYHTPEFEPHVTLLGEVEKNEEEGMVYATSSLSHLIKPFEIRLDGLDYGGENFKSLFVKVKADKHIINAYLLARKIFKPGDKKYMPHLSLLYGNLSPRERKAIIGKIGNFDLSFEADKIHLFSTKGEPKKWYKVNEFELKTK